MLFQGVFAMRLIRRIVSLLPILDEVKHLRPTLLGVDDLGNQLSRLSGGQGW